MFFPTYAEGSPIMAAISSLLHRQARALSQVESGVLRAMSQMKPANSRAMAANTSYARKLVTV